MALSRKSKSVLLLISVTLLLAGCTAEYMNNWDRVSARAGNAHFGNTAIMEVEPSNTNNTASNVGG